MLPGWSFSPTEMSSPAPPWVELDSVILPWSTLASGGEVWVLMPWRGSGFPAWIYLLTSVPKCLPIENWLRAKFPVSATSSSLLEILACRGLLLVVPAHQNSLQHCPRLPASYLQNVNVALWPRLAQSQ